ncbi:hypothetical protein P3X46_018676 [Hevea brasiliensis]|uniref:glucan endo-1,3-beta-D-glucosidase n=1 Tax=Hevea brasiliensis TaxID=3981 RepID=A0ABQ9LTE0_HEVBR|nr:glucan endo-1,3-beta-glucosidase 12 isoform X1 [Hevea brasiliensis]KAJ9170578.1 hypothetical protein P3X46_018676 [Hevea brasiliensis]
MLKMGWLVFNLFLLCFLGLTGAGQETIQIFNLYDATPGVLQAMSQAVHPLAVSLSAEYLNGVSSSVLVAESWLRNHVLVHFSAINISTIVVGNALQCQNGQNPNWSMVLPSLKTIYYSLTRWGLEREIKVSAGFSPTCLDPNSELFTHDLAEKVTKPLVWFLHGINSTCSINLPPNFSPLSDETVSLVSSLSKLLKNLGSVELDNINVMVTDPKQHVPTNRKLSTFESKIVNSYPARPTPLPESSQTPIYSSIVSAPSNVAKNPHRPLPHVVSPPLSLPRAFPPPLSFPLASPPPVAFPFAPEQPPLTGPATAPYVYSLPPCNPADTIAPVPEAGVVQELWCVAKPSVPAEYLQEAMDYACGDGGADCTEIMPHGSCFYPDTVVAHASYAFNSYFQKTKRNGGTCNFGGTAMLITSDPSFLHCRFLLS